MLYYRCKCGNSTAFGSMPPNPCDGCSKCNTTLALHPDYHRVPEPHKPVTRYDNVTGKSYQVCLTCMKKLPDESDS
jgi:hypothetical protein